jgi:hypothetical protein
MKKENSILLLLISSLIFSTGFIKKTGPMKDKQTHNSAALKKSNKVSHEVVFTFIGNVALYGTPEDCGMFTPDTVVLKGVLSGDENVGRYDPVFYSGVLHINIKMAVCNAIRVNGEDKLCIMSVDGKGPVETELTLDTSAHEGYGYITINYTPALGTFEHHVNGTCDTHEMKEEEDNNVPNNSIASIFNGCELRSLKKVRKLQRGIYPPDSGPGGTTTVEVKY